MKKYKDPLKRFLYSLLCPGTEIWDVDGLGGIPVEIQRVLGTPSWPMFFFLQIIHFHPSVDCTSLYFFFYIFLQCKSRVFFLIIFGTFKNCLLFHYKIKNLHCMQLSAATSYYKPNQHQLVSFRISIL